MSSIQWIGPGAAVARPDRDAAVTPARATAPRPARRSWAADVYAVLLMLGIIGVGILATVDAIEQYRWEKAALAAFNARQVKGTVVPPLFDRPARERFVGEMVGDAGFLVLELVTGLLLRRHARAAGRGERRSKLGASRRRATKIVVTESFHETSVQARSRAAAAERAAVVVWGDRIARHEAMPNGD